MRNGLLTAHLVEALDVKSESSLYDFASQEVNAKVIIEKIPWRLFLHPRNTLSLTESLYILDGILDGMEELCKTLQRAFDIQPEMVGINHKGVVKIWTNANFGKNMPKDSGTSKIERSGIHSIVDLMESHTRDNELSEFLRRIRSSNLISFYKFRSILDEFMKEKQIIPNLDIGLQLVKEKHNPLPILSRNNSNSTYRKEKPPNLQCSQHRHSTSSNLLDRRYN